MRKRTNKTLYIIIISAVCALTASCFTPPEPLPSEEYATPQPSADSENIEKSIRMALVTDDFVMESWPVMDELYMLSGMKAYYKTIRPDDWQDSVGRIMIDPVDYDFVELDSYNAELYKEKLLDISPYLEEYAPNYLEWANTIPEFASNYAYGQPITYFPFREDTNKFAGCVFADPSIRGQRSMGMEEFTEFMTGKQIVFKGSTKELIELIAPYFGTSVYWYTVEGQQIYGPTSEEFKLMLRNLNNFYGMGIIPSDFEYCPPSEFTESVDDNIAGIALAAEEDFEWLYEQGYKPIMLNFSSNSYVPVYPSQVSKMGGIIAGTGKEMDVLSFINTCFSKEGRALLNYGVNGVHTLAHNDGSIEYLKPYTQSGTYQWVNQGLTPEGLPGIYYNSWAKYNSELLDELINLRQYMPDSSFLIPTTSISYTSYRPKIVTKETVEKIQYEWWTAFIKGEKSVDWDWGAYLAAMNNSGCTQGYLESFN